MPTPTTIAVRTMSVVEKRVRVLGGVSHVPASRPSDGSNTPVSCSAPSTSRGGSCDPIGVPACELWAMRSALRLARHRKRRKAVVPFA